MSKDDEEWNAPNMRGLDFLDTIPEDASVTAARAAALSTASAVASSDDGEGPINGRRGAVTPSEMGQSVVSETPGVLGGDTSDQQQQAPDAASTASRKCTRRTLMFYVILSFMLVAVAVGIYYVARASKDEDESKNPFMAVGNTTPSQPPSEEEPALAPFDTTFLESETPTASPSYNFQDVMDLDQALLQISSAQDLDDPDTPQATCSHWLSRKDGLSLRVSEVGSERIVQRYVLCALYYATNGDEWIETFLDGTLHECDWNGVYCQDDIIVNVVELPEAYLVGSLPEELIYLGQLQALMLSGNFLTGTLPSQLFELSSLIWLDLDENLLAGTIPTPRSDSPLEFLYLDRNQFSGTLPFFPELQEMVVSVNSFQQIDSRYATLETLKYFVADENILTGKLPDTWDAPNLSYLDLHSNLLNGTIPASIWALPKLESLVLHLNDLIGALPSKKISNSFRDVWLQSNDLSGSIPESFGANCVNLTTMLLYYNRLSGTVDTQCSSWSQLERLETDCIVSCTCCTDCK
jgi:hypothetical protein